MNVGGVKDVELAVQQVLSAGKTLVKYCCKHTQHLTMRTMHDTSRG